MDETIDYTLLPHFLPGPSALISMTFLNSCDVVAALKEDHRSTAGVVLYDNSMQTRKMSIAFIRFISGWNLMNNEKSGQTGSKLNGKP